MPCPRTTASRQPRMSPRTWSLLCLESAEVQTAVAPRGHRLSTLRQGTVRGRAHTERTSATLMELPRVLRDPCFQIRHLTTHRCAPAPSEDTRRLRATSSTQFRSAGTRSWLPAEMATHVRAMAQRPRLRTHATANVRKARGWQAELLRPLPALLRPRPASRTPSASAGPTAPASAPARRAPS